MWEGLPVVAEFVRCLRALDMEPRSAVTGTLNPKSSATRAQIRRSLKAARRSLRKHYANIKVLAEQRERLKRENADLLALLDVAHSTVTWAAQFESSFAVRAGFKWYRERRVAYYRARADYVAQRRPLSGSDVGGCYGCTHSKERGDDGKYTWTISPDCGYHYGASLQPWNHRIPWNCPTYWDGCNCPGGPFYEMPDPELPNNQPESEVLDG